MSPAALAVGPDNTPDTAAMDQAYNAAMQEEKRRESGSGGRNGDDDGDDGDDGDDEGSGDGARRWAAASSVPAVGIDLGTTNSVLCVWSRGRPTLVPNAEGRTLTPSVVAFLADTDADDDAGAGAAPAAEAENAFVRPWAQNKWVGAATGAALPAAPAPVAAVRPWEAAAARTAVAAMDSEGLIALRDDGRGVPCCSPIRTTLLDHALPRCAPPKAQHALTPTPPRTTPRPLNARHRWWCWSATARRGRRWATRATLSAP